MASDKFTQFDDLMENLTNVDTIDLIGLADRTDYLFTLEPSDLVYLIGELAGRLEDTLPTRVEFDDDGSDAEDETHGTEYNG